MADLHLDSGNIDDLARMVTALLMEVWIMRDRMAVMERLYGDRLGVGVNMLDNYIPDTDFAEELAALRDRVIGAVVGAPIASRERGVDQILARAGMARPHPAGAGA